MRHICNGWYKPPLYERDISNLMPCLPKHTKEQLQDNNDDDNKTTGYVNRAFLNIDALVQDCSKSSALAMELPQAFTSGLALSHRYDIHLNYL